MSELLVELFSEEIPSNLQIHTRQQLENLLKQNLSSSNLKPKSLEVFSTPTRLTIYVTGLPKIIKIPAAEIKGPKVDVPESVINNYAKSKNLNVSDLQKKDTEKGTFYFAKVKGKEISTDKELEKIIPQTLKDINWKKYDVDYVFECTGKFNSKEQLLPHINNGAKKVIVSAPCKNADKTVVFGVNENTLTKKDKIIITFIITF
mgnify:CR=1 FL=1